MLRWLIVGIALFCAGLFVVAQAQDTTCIGCGVSGIYKASGGGSPTYTAGADVAPVNLNFSGSPSFSGLNGGVNFPSGAVVVVGFFNYSGIAATGPEIGGQAATLVTGSNDSSGDCALYQATMPSSEPDTFTTTNSGAYWLIGVASGYFKNLSSSTVSAAGNETFGANADPQKLSATLTVPSSGFGFAFLGFSLGPDSTTVPSALSWTGVTASAGDNFGSFVSDAGSAVVGSAHTATAGSGWNPEVSGVTNAMSFAACMSAGTWH